MEKISAIILPLFECEEANKNLRFLFASFFLEKKDLILQSLI
jgi:hypothetical protein